MTERRNLLEQLEARIGGGGALLAVELNTVTPALLAVARSLLDDLGTASPVCHCEPGFTDRGRHAGDCIYKHLSQETFDALAALAPFLASGGEGSSNTSVEPVPAEQYERFEKNYAEELSRRIHRNGGRASRGEESEGGE